MTEVAVGVTTTMADQTATLVATLAVVSQSPKRTRLSRMQQSHALTASQTAALSDCLYIWMVTWNTSYEIWKGLVRSAVSWLCYGSCAILLDNLCVVPCEVKLMT